MQRDLVKLANRLDSLGLRKEADMLDAILRKMAAKKYDFSQLPGESFDQYSERIKPIVDAANDEYDAVCNNFFENKPATVEEQVKYYGENLAAIEADAQDSGNRNLLGWTQILLRSFGTISLDLEEGRDSIEFERVKQYYPDWTPEDFKRAYEIYKSLKG